MAGDLTVITISFKTENDMTFWSADVEQEREKLLEIVSDLKQIFFSPMFIITEMMKKNVMYKKIVDFVYKRMIYFQAPFRIRAFSKLTLTQQIIRNSWKTLIGGTFYSVS